VIRGIDGVYAGLDQPYPFWTLQRNIIVWGSDQPLGFAFLPDGNAGAFVQDDNVFWNTGNAASGNGCIGNPANTWITAEAGNCFWNAAGAENYFLWNESPNLATPWSQWTALGYDAHSQWVNPNLSGASALYATQGTSVLPTGFQDWDHALAGRTSGVGGVLGGNLPFPTPAPAFY
jgi:hypothetical protein